MTMTKNSNSADELAKKAIKSNPMFMENEPNIVGNPANLNKSDKEIADEEEREKNKKGS